MPLDDKLPDRLLETYIKCIEAKEVLYYPSEVTKEDNELRTEIRLCESLANKPGPPASQLKSALKSVEEGHHAGVDAEALKQKLKEAEQKQAEKKDEKPKDVFAPENWDTLLADEFDGGVGESYGVLLNKYAVVPLHFLIATKHWEKQTAPLTPAQLLASYQLISLFASTNPHTIPESKSISTDSPGSAENPLVGGDLLCFFNCGDMSGASQPHKHIQFAPMAGEGSIGHFPTEKAAEAHDFQGSDPDKPFSLQELPYVHHIRRLNPPPCPHPLKATKEKLLPTMRYLQEAYLSLLDAMLDDLRLLHHANPDLVPDDKLKLGSGLSYNLLMTKKHMHIIARREATYLMDDPEHSDKQEGQDSLKPSQEPTDKAGSTPSGKAVTEPAIIGCNSLAYTGTVLVKSSEDAKKLSKQGGVLAALKHCGFPKPSTVMADTHHD